MSAMEIALAIGAPILSGGILALWRDVSTLKVQTGAMKAEFDAVVPRLDARMAELVNEIRELRKDLSHYQEK